jgi:hypothetical protein
MKKEYQRDICKVQGRNDDSNQIHAAPSFTSITRIFLSSTTSKDLKCPQCGALLNFTSGIEWIGPDSFTCGSCEKLINIRLIQQALRDLGVD